MAFSEHLPSYVDISYGINVDKKWTFLDHLPTSSCKRSLWTTPMLFVRFLKQKRLIPKYDVCDVCIAKFSQQMKRYHKLSFCQNYVLLGGSFWQKVSLITHTPFELQPIIIFSPVAVYTSLHICAIIKGQQAVSSWFD